MSKLPNKVLISDLQSKIREIQSEVNPAQFFSKVASYGKYLIENETISQILKSLFEESKKDSLSYNQAFERFIKKWHPLAQDLLRKAETAGIQDDSNSPVPGYIADINERLKLGTTLYYETDLDHYMGPYRRLIWRFNDIGKSELLIPVHFEPTERILKIEPEYEEAEQNWSMFKQVRETTAWWAHYKILILSASILDIEGFQCYFEEDNYVNRFYRWEFNEIIAGHTPQTPIFLYKEKFTLWVSRLHNYLIPRLENEIEPELPLGIQQVIINIPENRKTRHIRKMADQLKNGKLVSNFELVKCITSSLTRKKYSQSQKDYDDEVHNRLRTLKKYLKKDRYTVKSVGDGYKLQKL